MIHMTLSAFIDHLLNILIRYLRKNISKLICDVQGHCDLCQRNQRDLSGGFEAFDRAIAQAA